MLFCYCFYSIKSERKDDDDDESFPQNRGFSFLVFGEWKAKWVEVKLTPYDTWKYVYNIASFN